MTTDSSSSVPHVNAGGARIPALGLGTWQNTGPQCAKSVEMALEMGRIHNLSPGLGMRLENALPSVMRHLPFTPPA